MRYGQHLPQNTEHKLDHTFVLGQFVHEAARGEPWIGLDVLTRTLSDKRHFTTTDLLTILSDLQAAKKITKEARRKKSGNLTRTIDHFSINV